MADAASRRDLEENDWDLSSTYFDQIAMTFGNPRLDLFATNITAKCTEFVSWKPCPGAWAIDAFTISWEQEFFYAFPPFSLVSRVLRKIQSENCTGILVVRNWPSQIWYPKFLSLSHSDFITIGPSPTLLMCPYSGRQHPLSDRLQLAVALVQNRCGMERVYRKR